MSEEDPSSTPGHEPDPTDTKPSAPRISLLNSAPCLPKEQILAMVPPRKVVDRLVAQFFNDFDMARFILCRDRFLAEYASFWGNPSAAPIMWIGLLFSVMSMSSFLQKQDITANSISSVDIGSQSMLETYRTLTIHCLVAGDYLQPSKYTIETLMLHYSADQNSNFDGSSVANWVLMGVIIRIAFRMGFHRDPSHWPHMAPYQAELRRRLWIVLYQMDFFTSTQLGLPRIIKDSQCDTHLPTHLLAHDLTFDHDALPPERPLTEFTPLLIVIQRHAIIKAAAEIYDATEAGQPSPATSASLGAKLQSAIDAIPEWLKFKSLDVAFAESPIMMTNQMFLDILVHKAVYLLHRRSFVKDTTGTDGTVSKELCVKASLAILEHQQRIDEETKPGGLMFAIRWKVGSALNHEFLQATMMLCFVLSTLDGRQDSSSTGALQSRDDIVQALTQAKVCWEKDFNQSIQARRAVRAIGSVLQQNSDATGHPLPVTASSNGELRTYFQDCCLVLQFELIYSLLMSFRFDGIQFCRTGSGCTGSFLHFRLRPGRRVGSLLLCA